MATQEQVEQAKQFLGLKVQWLWAGPDNPPLTSHHPLKRYRNIATHRIEGVRNSGKSALGENIAFNYRDTGSAVYDFFAANDNESLAALESPFKDDVVLVHGDDVKLNCNFSTIAMDKLNPWTTPDGKVYVTCKKFWASEYSMYAGLLAFTERIKDRDNWGRVDVIFIREAQEYLSSRTETNQAETKTEAEGAFIKFHNQAVHSGFAVVLDSQRHVEVAKNLRELATFTYYKKLGGMEIPKKLYWIMSPDRANFSLDALRDLDEDQFLIITDDNAVGMGTFEYPPWHITRGSGLLRKLNIFPQKFADGTWKDISVPEPVAPPPPKEPKYKKVAERGLPDKRVVVTQHFRDRIAELKGAGLGAKKIYETIVPEGYQGKLRSVEGALYAIKVAKIKEQGNQNAGNGSGSS